MGTVRGGVHRDERPEQAVVREIREEVGLQISSFAFYRKFRYVDAEEEHEQYVFFKHWEVDVDRVCLREGLGLAYFAWEDVLGLELGFNVRSILEDFRFSRGGHF